MFQIRRLLACLLVPSLLLQSAEGTVGQTPPIVVSYRECISVQALAVHPAWIGAVSWRPWTNRVQSRIHPSRASPALIATISSFMARDGFVWGGYFLFFAVT